MIMNEQVLSIEQMQHLIELGVDTSQASMLYCDYNENNSSHTVNILISRDNDLDNSFISNECPAFTIIDAMEIMPKYIGDYKLNWYISDRDLRYDRINCCDKIEVLNELYFPDCRLLDLLFNMLCKLVEGGFLKKH